MAAEHRTRAALIAKRLSLALFAVLALAAAAFGGLLALSPLAAESETPLPAAANLSTVALPIAGQPTQAALTALRVRRTEPAAPLEPSLSLAAVPGVIPPEPDYAGAVLDYLSEVGFGQEYGRTAPVLHKWTRDVTLRVNGEPTAADTQAVEQVIDDLDRLQAEIQIEQTRGNADLEVYFAPEASFPAIEPLYVPGNLGFFRVWWDRQGAIYKARILIASEGISQQERSHLIREEITQSLGLFRDSWQYPDSIFYQGWTATGEFSPIDTPTIQLLYQPQLRPGMTSGQVRDLLSLD